MDIHLRIKVTMAEDLIHFFARQLDADPANTDAIVDEVVEQTHALIVDHILGGAHWAAHVHVARQPAPAHQPVHQPGPAPPSGG